MLHECSMITQEVGLQSLLSLPCGGRQHVGYKIYAYGESTQFNACSQTLCRYATFLMQTLHVYFITYSDTTQLGLQHVCVQESVCVCVCV